MKDLLDNAFYLTAEVFKLMYKMTSVSRGVGGRFKPSYIHRINQH